MKLNLLSAATLIAAAAAVCPLVHADVVTMNPSKDSALYENPAGGTGNGSGEHMFAGLTNSLGKRRALLRFPVFLNLPTGATVTNVQLKLTMSKTSASGNKTMTLRPVLQNWGEGASNPGTNEGSGAAAQPNDATWKHTFFNTALWNNLGGDFGPPSATQVFTGSGNPNAPPVTFTFNSTAGMVADVQNWLDDPGSNNGWIIVGDENYPSAPTAFRFDSRTYPDANRRPMLVVTYTAPPAGLKGDLNNDTLVDGEDVQRFLDILISGGGTAQELNAGDVENTPDGMISASDIPNFVTCLLNGGCP